MQKQFIGCVGTSFGNFTTKRYNLILFYFLSHAGKPNSHTEYQEASHASVTNNVQSHKPASCNAVRDNTSSETGPCVPICAELLGKDVSLAAPPYYTNVSAVTRTTTSCDQAKVTSFQSDATLVRTPVRTKEDCITAKCNNNTKCNNHPKCNKNQP